MAAFFTPADWQAHVERVIAARTAAGGPVRFVQIGAMDGVQFDPIHHFVKQGGWHGLFCEPMPFHMESLKKAYEGLPNLHFLQAAVTAESGPVSMTYLPLEAVEAHNIKRHAVGMGCIDYARSGFAKQTPEGRALLEPLMQRITVRGATLNEAMAEAGLDEIDIYVSDTEGHDAIILQQLDTTRFHPQLLLIEHEHLTPDEKIGLIARFRPLGYREFFAQGRDGEDLLFVKA